MPFIQAILSWQPWLIRPVWGGSSGGIHPWGTLWFSSHSTPEATSNHPDHRFQNGIPNLRS